MCRVVGLVYCIVVITFTPFETTHLLCFLVDLFMPSLTYTLLLSFRVSFVLSWNIPRTLVLHHIVIYQV
jgi:hypothetical protein